jgi:hypothetical protein
MTPGASNLLYVYAFVPGSVELPEKIAGIDDRLVRLLADGNVAAAYSEVPPEEFEEEPLNRLMREMEWLAPRATAHQAVNAALMERAEALLPLSFGAVYRDPAGIVRTLRERKAELAERLDAVRGRSEWVATLHRDEPRALAAAEESDPDLARLNEEIAAAAPGRAFLLRRRLEEVRKAALERLDREAAAAAVVGLADLVERVHAEPIVRTSPDAPLARTSLLVRREDEGDLVQQVADLARRWEERGYALRLTGPWPPYRFGGITPEATGAAAR